MKYMPWLPPQQSQIPMHSSNANQQSYSHPNYYGQRNVTQDAEALRLAITNLSALLNSIALSQQVADQIIVAMNANDVSQMNSLLNQLGMGNTCKYTTNGFCCDAGGKKVCMRITIQ
ncbi:hypothetical protein IAW_05765 [Bacillus cereus str. Schrouff]|uniref:hypothetical protein n=1 Tax=Bacillus cereus TaxID=1396 RepID=UPI00032F2900|nr:hypothetical protein [Bacillus cereus]EOO04947.1 hypothetical protein IAW_05765 [Bacillus cereus str. Schrouff]EOO81719.1 hypothetical protein IGY_05741 [Bacillus cereus K-5975c]